MMSFPVFLTSVAATVARAPNTFTQSDIFNSVSAEIASAMPVFDKVCLVAALRIAFIAFGAIAGSFKNNGPNINKIDLGILEPSGSGAKKNSTPQGLARSGVLSF